MHRNPVCKKAYARTLSIGFLMMLPSLAWSLDYYWVGGSGNWSELRHWATTSGGSVNHDQIPTAADHVIIDGQSFTNDNAEIIMDLDNIFCHNFDFRQTVNQVILSGSRQTTINIFGSLYMHPDVTLDFAGSIDFRADQAGNEISFKGQRPFELRFTGDGSWTVIDDVNVDSLIHISFGHIVLDSISLGCHRFEVFSSGGVKIDFGNSGIMIRGNRQLAMPIYQWRESLHFEGPVTTTAGNSLIHLGGRRASIGFHRMDHIELGNVTLGRPGGKHRILADWQGQFNFKKLHLRGDTRLEGGLTIAEFELDGGNIYTFQSNTDQRIGQIKTNTDCEMIALLRATEGGRPATLVALNGTQQLSHTMIQDMVVQGATFEVSDAVDLGGNIGWDMTEKTATTLYWVGGSGSWNETNHWSFSSGGPPSGCLPTAIDDVIFDAASFTAPNQTVTINVPSAFCHTMDWRNIDQRARMEQLAGQADLSLHIYGSLYFSLLTQNAFNGDVHFESAHQGNEIASADNEYVKNVFFGSALGEWTLLDELDVNDSLYFNAGELVTNDMEVECFDFYSESNSPRKLKLGNSIMRIVPSTHHMYSGSNFRINATNFDIDPGTSTLLAEHNIYANFYNSGRVDFYRVIFHGYGGINISETTNTTFRNTHFHHDGDFRGEINMDTLTFSPTKAYWMFMNSIIRVDSMSAHGNCDGAIFIAGYPKGITGTIEKINGTLRVSNTMLEGIVGLGGASFVAAASQDLGLNQGWTFTDAQPRMLYWVGGDGAWFDRSHWSLSSGGPGGECVPTAIDDVFLDGNSFTGTFQSIDLVSSNGPICHDLTWKDAMESTGLYNGAINITGSLDLQPNLEFYPWNITFRSDSSNNEIHSGDNELNWVEIMGDGVWTLHHEMHVPYQMNLWQGTLITDDFDMRIGRIFMGSYPVDFRKRLELGNSHIILGSRSTWNEQLYIATDNFSIDPGNSLVEFEDDFAGIKHYGSSTLNLHNVYFSNIQGESRIEEFDQANFLFNKLEFNNNGVILNNNEMDTLLLAAGKSYQLENSKTQKVNRHLRAIGNNCTPIALASTTPGQRSTISSSDATVIGDFIQMRDQLATGGARFSAGAHSTDISNNSGWVFEEDPDFVEIGFLGPDRALCIDSMIEFNAFNFSPQEQYTWNTGDTDPAITVADPGLYWAEVKFQDNCIIRDSIEVWTAESIQVNLGSDSTLCEGDTLELSSGVDFPQAEFTWHDQSIQPSYLVQSEGVYSLMVEADGCSYADTISISYNPLPEVGIQGLEDACDGDTIVLDASLPNATFLWQDQSTDAILPITQDGTYFVQAEIDHCVASDTVRVDFFPLPNFDLGPDTTLCEGESLDLIISGDSLTYQWQNGAETNQFTVEAAGIYWADVRLAHCMLRDSVQVQFKPIPTLPNFKDTALCEGTNWQIQIQEPNVNYQWNTGDQSGEINITTTGDYHLSAELNGCNTESEFRVQFEPPPGIDLGPDMVHCEGEEISIQLNDAGVAYSWQDGSQTGIYQIHETGTYVATATKLNCTRSDTIDVLIHPIPRFSLGGTQYPCPSDTFIIAPDQSQGQLTWSDGSQGSQIRGTAAGIYWLEMEDNGCRFRDTVSIVHQEIPNIQLGNDTTLCHDQTLTLNARHSWVEHYQWQDGTIDPTFEVTEPGVYTVMVNDDLCESEFSIEVNYDQCQYFSMYLPNAFTPNGDGNNDLYLPFVNPNVQIERFAMQIFNRWGQLLFVSDNVESGWNGTVDGQPYTPDTFVVRVEVEYIDDLGRGSIRDTGTITLLK